MVHPQIKVAFYLDSHSLVAIAERAIESVRETMPHAEIWHLTTLDGPKLSVDKELRLDVSGEFAYRQAAISAEMVGDVLFLDVDTIVRADVSHVFDDEFDVCVTTDMKPGSDGIKYNGGVIFSRSQDYWRQISTACAGMDFCKSDGDWEPIERARGAVADSGLFKLKILPGEQYNYIPDDAEDTNGLISHYRGSRKSWMIPIQSFDSSLNTSMNTMISQAVENIKRPLIDFGRFVSNVDHGLKALIIGGGPSLKETLSEIKKEKENGAILFALNNSGNCLIENGVIPDYVVILDARKENADFVKHPNKDVKYLIAAQCHPDVFNNLSNNHVIRWIACTDSEKNDIEISKHFPNKRLVLVGGGATVALKTMNICYLLGYRNIQMFGVDSSYEGDNNHAYKQTLNDGESKMTIHAAGKDFICAPWMAKQVQEFQQQYRQFLMEGCSVKVSGEGLLPHVFRVLENNIFRSTSSNGSIPNDRISTT